ncbi:hypothetical protein PLESTB_001720200 [Pleodorina starrii]|uniref:Arylamine N-acetyltransferase n=1 Tax=Pleodorina starrii TaxID=330485 RepID=A0A9W6BYX3_9CHLO|nr:hypothetical protein PLESTB_001720200 [Pleodorina starrii]
MDVEAYLQAVGLTGAQLTNGAEPDSLKLIYSHHVRALPFSSVPIICGRPVDPDLDIAGIADKMITKRWGGVCFEHVALLGAALKRLGFNVTYLGGEVWRDGWTPTNTHASLLVSFSDQTQYFCDVGFPLRPLEPLLLQDGREQAQSDGRVFLLEAEPLPEREAEAEGERGEGQGQCVAEARCWGVHQLDKEGDFELRHRFRLRPCALSDFSGPVRDLASPGHRFSSGWIVAICRPDGALVTLATGPWAGSEVPEDKAKYVCRRVVAGGEGRSTQHVTTTALMTRGSVGLQLLAEREFRIWTEDLVCADLPQGEAGGAQA